MVATEFNPIETPISPGITLVEAAAGTGKTHALVTIYFRLLIERGLSPTQILTVTFTEAATEELRARVRRFLLTLLQKLKRVSHDGAANDEFDVLLSRARESVPSLVKKLEFALNEFDQIPISTIHGFCHQILNRFPFETRHFLHTELHPDAHSILVSLAEEFWRSELSRYHSYIIALAVEYDFTPDKLAEFWMKILSKHKLRVYPELPDCSVVESLEKALVLLRRIQKNWRALRESVQLWLEENGKFLRKPWREPHQVEFILSHLDYALGSGQITPFTLGLLSQLTPSELETKINKRYQGKAAPLPESLDVIGELFAHQADVVTALRFKSIKFLTQHFEVIKKTKGIQLYEDLLLRVEEALRGSDGEKLLSQLRHQYRAALVDEFQDTDPVQFGILSKIFCPGRDATERFLILIGDPKQSIYGFRGADVMTYLKVASEVKWRFTLTRNWRSSPQLLAGINAIFCRHPRPFVHHEIRYLPVVPSDRARSDFRISIEGTQEPAFEIWIFGENVGGGRASSEALEQFVAETVANEVVRLLQKAVWASDGKRITPSDIAILVRENRQAELMQQALSARKVPTVLHSTKSVFWTKEALDLWYVLNAIADSTNEGWIRAALLTPLFGKNLSAVNMLSSDEVEWEKVIARFRRYCELWERRGILPMFYALMEAEEVKSNLMRLPNGERRVSNTLQLVELLYTTECKTGPDPWLTLEWFARRILARGLPPEEYQLRLESDKDAVRIVTIHRSKGLEYNIVFCPFSWRSRISASKSSEEPVFAHDPVTKEPLLELDPRSRAKYVPLAWKEELAEDVRTAYVALTRAKAKCYLVWSLAPKNACSGLTWLLVPPADSFLEDANSSGWLEWEFDSEERKGNTWFVPWAPTVDQARARERLISLQQEDPEAIKILVDPSIPRVEYGADDEKADNLAPPPRMSRHPQVAWTISSYSSIVGGVDADRPDYDAWVISQPEIQLPPNEFPRGAMPGTCLHRILEKVDLSDPDSPANIKIISEELSSSGFPVETFLPVVQRIVGQVARMELIASPGLFARDLDAPASGIKLGEVPANKKVPEFEFTFSARAIDWTRVACLLESAGIKEAISSIAQWQATLPTFLKGYIDLVFEHGGKFYILDWKSNFLGLGPEDYSPEKLAAEILRQHYYLQYLLYTLALDKFFSWRLPGYTYERCFGGVWYVFLRGLSLGGSPCGVYFDYPPSELIRELRECFAGI